MTKEQKQLKNRALKLIDIIEERTAEGRGVGTCFFMPRDYKVFLRENGVLKNPSLDTITYSVFNARCKDRSSIANLFRMMVITEYCKQKGVKI
jgi:hypothetical protein